MKKMPSISSIERTGIVCRTGGAAKGPLWLRPQIGFEDPLGYRPKSLKNLHAPVNIFHFSEIRALQQY